MDKLKGRASSLTGSSDSLPPSFGSSDGREESCLEYVRQHAKRNNPQSVTQAIDAFCYNNKWMMNVGDVKGKILVDSIKRAQPKVVLELGTYVGYSSLAMISNMPEDARIVTVDISKKSSNIARQMFDFAGVSSRVQPVVGHLGDKSGATIKAIEQELKLAPGSVDFVFIDHAKEVYLSDLKLILERKWLHPGSVVVADNVLFPGAPDYREFMKQNEGKIFKTTEVSSFVEYQSKIPDLVLVSTYLGDASSSKL